MPLPPWVVAPALWVLEPPKIDQSTAPRSPKSKFLRNANSILEQRLEKMYFKTRESPADGNSLFSAISDQLYGTHPNSSISSPSRNQL